MTKELPDGWVWATLGEVAESVKNGIFVSRAKSDPDGVPILRIGAVRPMSLDLSDLRYSRVYEDELRSKGALLGAGDLLFTRYNGNPDLVGACALVPEVGALTYPDKLIRVRVNRNIVLPEYVALAFSSQGVRLEVKQSIRSTAGQVGISGSDLKRIPIPIPPLDEQRRIVAALEAELSRIESAESLLGRSAGRFSGLISRFSDDRLDPLYSGDVRPLGEILREPLRNGHSARAVTEGGVRTLTLTSVTKGKFLDEFTKLTSADPEKVSNLWLQSGDIFIQRSNAPDLVGTAALYEGVDGWSIFPDLLIRVRVAKFMDSSFVLRVLQSSRVRAHFKRSAKGLAGSMPKIDQRSIEQVMVPIPTLAEQGSVASDVNEYSDRLRRIHQSLDRGKARAEHLRRALLTTAFTGKLVPQDPSDEPASALLERIRAERAAVPKPKRGRKPKPSKTSASVTIPDAPRPVPAGEQTALEF